MCRATVRWGRQTWAVGAEEVDLNGRTGWKGSGFELGLVRFVTSLLPTPVGQVGVL